MKKTIALCLCALCGLALLAGCQSQQTKNPTCEEVLTAVTDAIGADNLPSMTPIDDDVMLALYGLTATDTLEDYRGTVAAINVRADEIIVMKVQDGKMADAEAGIEQRQQDLDATWSMYLPAVYETVKDARVVKNGNYLLFVVSDQADKAVQAFDEMTKA